MSEIQLCSKGHSVSNHVRTKAHILYNAYRWTAGPRGQLLKISSVRISHYSKGNYYNEPGIERTIYKD